MKIPITQVWEIFRKFQKEYYFDVKDNTMPLSIWIKQVHDIELIWDKHYYFIFDSKEDYFLFLLEFS